MKAVGISGAMLLALVLAAPAARSAPPSVPAVADFSGTWKIRRMIGASDGGVTAGDPKALVGKLVHWTATDVQTPEGTCHLKQPAVTLLSNETLETGLWGGQQIDSLNLSKAAIAQGFGTEQTPVF